MHNTKFSIDTFLGRFVVVMDKMSYLSKDFHKLTMQHTHLIIMAGGIGSRFWPMSTPETPKQFIDITGCGKTLIQLTVERFSTLVSPENVWVVTSERYRDLVREQLPEIPVSHILLEPCMRSTAPCIAYAGWKIKTIDTSASIVVTPADHIVTDTGEFRRVIASSLDFVCDTDAILTLGMRPTRPETGYGYIAADLSHKVTDEIYKVDMFREKPSLEKANEYLAAGNYLWNSGLFIWNVRTLETEFRTYCPHIAAIFDELQPALFTAEEQEEVNRLFPMCENISIDYAVMEKARDIYVFPADFGWSDLGTWGALHTLLPKDDTDNAYVGDGVKMVESSGCIVNMPVGKRVVVQGLDGYIVAEKDGTLLICRLADEQRIKDFSK